MFFPIILSGAVLILGGTICGRYKPPDVLYVLIVATFTGTLSSYLFFHFFIWKDTFGRNLLYAAAVLLLFGVGLLCGQAITKALCKKDR
jgi:predicted MFS family arabinose efflux permease